MFGADSFAWCHYVNFEEDERLASLFEADLRPQRILENLELLWRRSFSREQDLLVLDEIQRCPRALTGLKYFCEEMPETAVAAAGSLLGVVLGAESFPVGKIAFLDLWPMNFEEFLDGIGQGGFADLLRGMPLTEPVPEPVHDELWNLWRRYLVVGGLPEAVNLYRERQDRLFEAMEEVRRLQRDLIETYTADIAKHSGKMNALHIERLWRNVPAQLGQSQDGAARKFVFRDALPGMRGYDRLSAPLDWLESSRLVLRCSIVDRADTPLAAFSKENRFKLYFLDAGLLGAISGLAPAAILQYGFGTYQGYVAENFVAQELRAAGIPALYCWQGRTSEVEFLVETSEGPVPIEVKSGRVTRSRSLTVYSERYRPRISYVLSARNTAIQGDRRCLPIYRAGALARALRTCL
jgi:hypothetical protein